MIKWKVALLIILTVLVAIIIPVGGDMLAAHLNAEETAPVKSVEITDFSADTTYLGNRVVSGAYTATKFDVRELLALSEDAVVTVAEGFSEVASIEDNMISVNSFGELDLSVTTADGESTKSFVTVDAVNVVCARDFMSITDYYGDVKEGICIFSNIIMAEVKPFLRRLDKGVSTFRIKDNFYGNGFTLYCADYVKSIFDSALIFSGEDKVLRDVRFIGKVYQNDEDIVLDELVDDGILASFGEHSSTPTDVFVENCIFENSNRNVMLSYADVSFKGCLFQNAADTNVSLRSVAEGPSNITLENCVLANAVVGGIVNWCTDKIEATSICSITLKGFVDFYSWKNRNSARLVPTYEANSEIFNNIMQQTLQNKAMDGYLYKYGEHYYASTAILAISTAGNVKNKPVITGLSEQGMSEVYLPVEAYVAAVLKTSILYGYTDDSVIAPDKTLADNPYIYTEMKNGRH